MKVMICAVVFGASLVLPLHAQAPPPLRLAIAGLVHGHVSGFLRAAQGRKDVENLIATEILEAARESARKRARVTLGPSAR